jgi:hypothetical protein
MCRARLARPPGPLLHVWRSQHSPHTQRAAGPPSWSPLGRRASTLWLHVGGLAACARWRGAHLGRSSACALPPARALAWLAQPASPPLRRRPGGRGGDPCTKPQSAACRPPAFDDVLEMQAARQHHRAALAPAIVQGRAACGVCMPGAHGCARVRRSRARTHRGAATRPCTAAQRLPRRQAGPPARATVPAHCPPARAGSHWHVRGL